MAEANPTQPGAPVPSAHELRMTIIEAQMKKMEEHDKLRDGEEKKRADFAADLSVST